MIQAVPLDPRTWNMDATLKQKTVNLLGVNLPSEPSSSNIKGNGYFGRFIFQRQGGQSGVQGLQTNNKEKNCHC